MADAPETFKDDQHYLRLVLTAYWDDMPPSTEIFYQKQRLHHSLGVIAALEQSISDMMMSNVGKTPQRIIYNCCSDVEMSDTEATVAGWRVIGAATSPVSSSPAASGPSAIDGPLGGVAESIPVILPIVVPMPDLAAAPPSPDDTPASTDTLTASTSEPPSRADVMTEAASSSAPSSDSSPSPTDPSF